MKSSMTRSAHRGMITLGRFHVATEKQYKRMKSIITLWSTVLLVGAVACTDLETNPRQSLTPEVALNSVEGYQAVANSMYRLANSFTYYGQQMMIAPEILADNLRIVANSGRNQGEEVNGDRDHISLWNSVVYGAINDANLILAGIDAADVRGEQEQKDFIKGDAYFMRALFYFDLCRVYGYEPGKEVDGFNLGPILRLTPTLVASDADFRERATILEVYEQIESDLRASLELTGLARLGTENVYYANAGAALTLLARLYLYGDFRYFWYLQYLEST